MLITHDMAEADELADRVAIIDHGRLLALGTPAALKHSIQADTIVTVSADAVMLTVRAADSQAIFPAILAAAQARHIALREVRVDPPTLETVFIQLTGKELRES